MTDLDIRIPEFTIALRGYDRLQVDAYIDRLQGLLEETEERLRAVEPGDHHHEVGPRISQIFDLAAAEAQDVRAAAEHDSKRILDSARRDAEAVVERNQAEWETMLGEYEAERDRISAEVDELRGQKGTVLEEIRRLHAALGVASGLGPAAIADGGRDQSALTQAETVRLEPTPDAGEAQTRRFDPEADAGEAQTRQFQAVDATPDLRQAG